MLLQFVKTLLDIGKWIFTSVKYYWYALNLKASYTQHYSLVLLFSKNSFWFAALMMHVTLSWHCSELLSEVIQYNHEILIAFQIELKSYSISLVLWSGIAQTLSPVAWYFHALYNIWTPEWGHLSFNSSIHEISILFRDVPEHFISIWDINSKNILPDLQLPWNNSCFVRSLLCVLNLAFSRQICDTYIIYVQCTLLVM